MPKISVIIPIYNVEKYLKQCLTSVVNQTLQDIEIICIDNGAKTTEKNIINSFKNTDCRIKVIEFAENKGYGKAINTGIDNATGEYIAIVEADDYIDSDFYENMYNKACKFDADIVKSTYYSTFNNGDEILELQNLGIEEDKSFTIFENPILFSKHPSIWSCLYKREFLDKNNLKFLEKEGTAWVDNHFQVLTLLNTNKIIFTKDAYYHYRRCRKDSSSQLIDGVQTPYLATIDVHSIFNGVNSVQENVLYNLAIREFSYIKEILHKVNFENRRDCETSITGLFDIISSSLNSLDKYTKFKKKYYKKSLRMMVFFNMLKKVFYIELIHKNIVIQILGNKYTIKIWRNKK